MPTLEETRRRFDADDSFEEKRPKASSAAGIDIEALRRRRVSRTREALGPLPSPAPRFPSGARITAKHYRILGGGNDAMIGFGKHRGECVSVLAASPMTRTYLQWMKTVPFPADLMAVIDRWLGTGAGTRKSSGGSPP